MHGLFQAKRERVAKQLRPVEQRANHIRDRQCFTPHCLHLLKQYFLMWPVSMLNVFKSHYWPPFNAQNPRSRRATPAPRAALRVISKMASSEKPALRNASTSASVTV